MEKITVRHGDHFNEEGFVSHARFLPASDYAMVRDSVVRACVDICAVNQKGEMLFGKRAWYPARDWWIIGGGMRPGESFREAASKNIKRELGLDIEPERFERLWEYSMAWAKRREPPEDNGCHDVSITMLLWISPEEEMQIKHNAEYEEIRWVGLEEVANDYSSHPALNTLAAKAIIKWWERCFVV